MLSTPGLTTKWLHEIRLSLCKEKQLLALTTISTSMSQVACITSTDKWNLKNQTRESIFWKELEAECVVGPSNFIPSEVSRWRTRVGWRSCTARCHQVGFLASHSLVLQRLDCPELPVLFIPRLPAGCTLCNAPLTLLINFREIKQSYQQKPSPYQYRLEKELN